MATGAKIQRPRRVRSKSRPASICAIRPTVCRAASIAATKSSGTTACMPLASGWGQAEAALKTMVAPVSTQASWRSSGSGIRIQVSSRSSARKTVIPTSMPIGST